MSRRRRAALTPVAALAVAGWFCLAVSPARAASSQESVFQDDNHLIYNTPATAEKTLAVLQSLGVARVRVTVLWSLVAPAASSRRRPAGFNATDPAAYPASVWRRYDTLVALAGAHRIGVEFNLTAPGPLWAMKSDSPTARAADHWVPDAVEFERFAYAVGIRYSGRYDHLPAVRAWSIWNEPNQPGWLAPQWRPTPHGQIPASPELYRQYVEAGFHALRSSGHTRGELILIGELAPEGQRQHGFYNPVAAMRFLRDLYCVNRSYAPLRGRDAASFGCPTNGNRRSFVSANPGLFDAGGFAHHPYYFFRAPSAHSPDRDSVPIADLGRLEHGLDRTFRAYRIKRKIPIYLTEYGYQTNPPDPYQLVTPAEQAVYLNEADYIAWHDPRVRSVAQFLLFDAGPDTRFGPSQFEYWDTFQTGLLFSGGTPKPGFAAYRMPIWLPNSHLRRGGVLAVWGQLRPARGTAHATALIQFRARHGRFRTIARAVARSPTEYFLARVRLRTSGAIRIAWRVSASRTLFSRTVRASVA